jgi:chromate reductase, NAD(P)H dehydrogenase (quinone)
MIHVPKAQEVFDEAGTVRDGQNAKQWSRYFGRTFHPLLWWASAAEAQRRQWDPHAFIEDFKRDPSQRNAPGASEFMA